MPAKAKDTTGPTQYRFIGDHATILESGQPLGVGEYVTLGPDDMVGHNQMLIDDGSLIDASDYNPVTSTATIEPPTEESET